MLRSGCYHCFTPACYAVPFLPAFMLLFVILSLRRICAWFIKVKADYLRDKVPRTSE